MIGSGKIFRESDVTRPMIWAVAAAAVWIAFAALMWAALAAGDTANAGISSSWRVLDYAMQFRALPRTNAAAVASGEPLGALSNIVDALGLRDRMQQLQSNPSGIVAQFEKLYGDELGDLLVSIENSGLSVKTAEIRALPGDGVRLLSAVLTMEEAK